MASKKDTRDGALRIMAERLRQIEKEGWTAEHDDEHTDGSLALAAICYAAPRTVFVREDDVYGVHFLDPWPESWDESWDTRPRKDDGDELTKPTRVQRIRLLEKAGALIAAEIDRLLRLEKRCGRAGR